MCPASDPKGMDVLQEGGQDVLQERLDDHDDRRDKVRTAQTLSEIANTLDRYIQFTWDSHELNVDKKLPVLDLKL